MKYHRILTSGYRVVWDGADRTPATARRNLTISLQIGRGRSMGEVRIPQATANESRLAPALAHVINLAIAGALTDEEIKLLETFDPARKPSNAEKAR